ncbi:conserved Plasmodium protein, unknown function [Plasmodium gallinaceum]|uniref:Uncharacterized protein n=1 Tax=Plasmodium gallinaceum TaxID=5849 RepID=A0A1J1H2P3_PLAGA|nr:conserved Plasmodium protein, unknown function [Plasmodium gallinaceum]CRG97755.1 conserved Plasmodium protein, unknown function [Plasmodium gallinaceum]
MNKKKSSRINVLNQKIEEKIKKEKKNNNKINNEVMKLINKEVIIDYCTNQKSNAKLILNRYLNIIKYLMKENLNLKKIIERNKLEDAQKDDIIIKHENELKKKNDIINDLINKLEGDILKENIKICDNSEPHESEMLIQENDNSTKVKSKKLIDLIKKNNSINSEVKQNIYLTNCHLNDNIKENDNYIGNSSLNYENENSKFTQYNEKNYIKKYLKDENNNSILKKKNYSSEYTLININKPIEKKHYESELHQIYTYNSFNKEKNLGKKKSSIFIREERNELLKDEKLNQKGNNNLKENSLKFFVNNNNKLHDDDECIDELNYLINNKSSIEKFENYSKKYEMEYKNINAQNDFIKEELYYSNLFQNEKKLSKTPMENKEYYMENSKMSDTYVKKKSINITMDNFDEKKENIDKNPKELPNKQIHDNSYYAKVKDENNIYINSGDESNTNIENRTNKNLVNKNMIYVNNDIRINNKLNENDYGDIYNKKNSNLSEKENKSDLEDANYEDLENIMSTILKLRKKS